VGITLNFNTVPDDPRPPFRASGLRIGTPSMTTQGMKEGEATEVAHLITEALKVRENESALADVAARVHKLATTFTPYPVDWAGHV